MGFWRHRRIGECVKLKKVNLENALFRSNNVFFVQTMYFDQGITIFDCATEDQIITFIHQKNIIY